MSDDCTKLLRRMTQVMWRVFCAGEPVILCVTESIFDYRISDPFSFSVIASFDYL